MIAGLSIWYVASQRSNGLEMARAYARAAHEKDVLYRRWNAFHGGVYVPVTKATPPNPYLDVPERDLVTPSGKQLTLVNPAYMTRQVHEVAATHGGINAHITSLKPLNPANAPGPWERRALEAIEQGQTEVSGIQSVGEEPHMRLIRPLYVEQGCLKCHGDQGYELGDVRGGISVSVPVASIWSTQSQQSQWVLFGYGCLWVLGIATIGFGGRELRRHMTQRETAARRLEATAEDLKRANASLQEQFAVARAATKAKSEFLANMSHEIRTPMTAILGFSDVLRGRLEDQQDVSAVETIKRNGEYLLELINDILDLSRIEAGKLEVERTECSPASVVNDVASLMCVPAESKGLRLEVEFRGAIPDAILSDPIRLRQILINLLGNAVKFTDAGGVRLVAQLVRGAGGPALLRFDVTDTGVGMRPDQLPELFEPFTQADSSTSRKHSGSGLGLAISRRLAEALGGDISVTSSLGKGSTFSLTVDTGSLEGVALRENATAEPAGIQREPAQTATAKDELDCRVLLAEDGPDNQRLISLILKMSGAVVEVAEDGQVACDMVSAANARGEPYDVILMDMMMPNKDGYQATRELRADGCTTAIIALTANAMAGDAEKCLRAGCDEYLAKPFDSKTFLPLVAQYARKRQTAEGRDVCIG